MTTVAVTRRFDLTDAQWAVPQPRLPKGKSQGDRKRHRAVATRYDKHALRYQATLHVVAINESL